MLEQAEVRRAPVGTLAIDEAAAREEFQDVVPRLENLALKRLATPHHIADALLRLARDAHRRELAGVPSIVFALHAGPFRDQRGRDHVAGVAPLSQRTVQNVPGAAGFVTGAKLTIAGQPVEKPLQLWQLIGESLDPSWCLRPDRQHRDRDRVLVHVHAEIDD